MRLLLPSLPRFKAFTFVELLIASAIFVGIAIIATSTLTATLTLQDSHKKYQNTATQSTRALQEISHDFAASLTGTNDPARPDFWPRVGVVSINQLRTSEYASSRFGNNPQEDTLIMTVPRRDGTGGAPSNLKSFVITDYEKHVYCGELQRNPQGTIIGKRLVRYTIQPANTLANLTLTSCDDGGMITLFPQAASRTKEYLTEENLQVDTLRIWPVWSVKTPHQDGSPYFIDPPAIRLELVSEYSSGNSALNSGYEQRASQTNPAQAAQLVFRSLATRTSQTGIASQP